MSANILILIALGLTTLVLLSGVVVMAIGGDINKKYGNRLMVLRVIAQAVVIFLLLMLYASS